MQSPKLLYFMACFIVFGMFSIALGAFSKEKSATDIVMEMAERCREFVNTGDFPSRGLYWVRNKANTTYEDRGSGLRVTFSDPRSNRLLCVISEHETGWSHEDQNAVFDAIVATTPEWVALWNGSHVEDIETIKASEEGATRSLTFSSNEDLSAKMSISLGKKTRGKVYIAMLKVTTDQ